MQYINSYTEYLLGRGHWKNKVEKHCIRVGVFFRSGDHVFFKPKTKPNHPKDCFGTPNRMF